MSKEEPIEKPPLIDFKLENEWGVFRIKEQKDGKVTVEIVNTEGSRVLLNDLLPQGWEFHFTDTETEYNTERKWIMINVINEARNEGWKYLLSILHEIGHVVIYESSEEERQKFKEREHLRFEIMEHVGHKLKIAIHKLEKLQSKMERDAWAWAVRQFHRTSSELGIDPKWVFLSNEEMRKYFNAFLLSYKAGDKLGAEYANILDEDKQELLQEIDKLYTQADKNKDPK